MAIGKQIDRYLARLIFVPLLGTFVLAAMLLLLDRMLKNGAHRETLLACVFGGASLMPGDVKGPALGSRNVAEAFEFLERNEIAVLRHDVEGRQGRKLTFRTADGTTLIRKL